MTRKLRSEKIEIDLPKEEGDIWVHAVLQLVLKDEDYETIAVTPTTGHVNRALSQFMLQMITVTDPVTGQSLTASGAGAAALVKALIITWMQEDFGGTINEIGDLILDEGL